MFLSVNIIIDPSNFNKNNFKGRLNTFCDNNSTGFDKLVCKNDIKNKKFIWIFIDSLAYDQLYFLKKKFDNREIALFNIFSETFAQSGAMHETLLTGKFSRNFFSNRIEIDQIFKQTKRKNYTVNYVGNEYPLLDLNGKEMIFNKILKKKTESYPFSSLCKNLSFKENSDLFMNYTNDTLDEESRFEVIKGVESNFDHKANIDIINTCFKELEFYFGKDNESNGNLVFYTPLIDHLNHELYKYHPQTIVTAMKYEEGIISLMKWVDENPQYVLFVSSDHGGQIFKGEDNYCIHGCIDNKGKTNGAFLMIYYKNISVFDDFPQFTRHVDVAPTVAQLLENVNIPLETTGFPLRFQNDPLLNLAQIRSKEIQLGKLIEFFSENNIENRLESQNLLQKLYENAFYKNLSLNYQNTSFFDNNFYNNYKQFILDTEAFFHEKIFKKRGNFLILISMLLLILKLAYLTGKCYQDNNLKLLSTIKQLVFIVLLYSFLNLDYIFFLIYEHNYELTYGYQYFINLIIIFLFLLYYFLWKKNLYVYSTIKDSESKSFNYKLLYAFFIIICGVIILLMLDSTFIKLKNVFSLVKELKRLDIISYIILFAYCIFTIRSTHRHHYRIFRIWKVRLDILYYIIQTILFSMLAYYDTIIQMRNYITSQDSETQSLAILIYYFFLCYTLFLSFSLKCEDKNGKTRFYSIKLMKLSVIPFIFFLSDSVDRIFLVVFMIPLYHFLSVFMKKNKKNFLIKLYLMICIVRIPDLFFYISKGTYTFTTSLDSANKTIFFEPEDTPILTGFFFGIYKFRMYILCALVILESSKYYKYEFNSVGRMFITLLDFKATLSIVFFFYNLYFDNKDLLLTTFMMFLAKSFILFLVYMVYTLATTVNLIVSCLGCVVGKMKNNPKRLTEVNGSVSIEVTVVNAAEKQHA